MTPRRTRQELEDLASLLEDFGAPGWTRDDAERAFDLIRDRSTFQVAELELDAELVAFRVGSIGQGLDEALKETCIGLHAVLFSGILRNAGQYRQATDPDGGYIVFGGLKGQTTEPLLRGAPPVEIEARLTAAFARLKDRMADAASDDAERARQAREDVTADAILFYKDYSGVHPFYDGNGRVGRYVVSIYLLLHGLYVRWGDLDAKERPFLKKINDCLRRSWNFESYEQLLVTFWSRYVEPVPPSELPGVAAP